MLTRLGFKRRGTTPPLTFPPPAIGPKKSWAERELPAELLKRLEFKVLRRLDGFLFGDYSGLFYGPSLDLAEVREYQPGDEVKRIDWNVTARTGTVHIRQYREEREIVAWLLVDQSASMNFGTRRMQKRQLAKEFSALVASILTRQSNKVGTLSFSENHSGITPLGSGRRQALSIVQMLEKTASTGNGVPTLAAALEHANRTLRRKSLIFVVSDFLNPSSQVKDTPDWAKGLQRLAYKHDVIAVRISDPAEHDLAKVGDLRLRDPETGEEHWVNTSDPRVQKAHAKLVSWREETLARTFRAAHVDTLALSTHEDMVKPLLGFTLKRSGRRL